MTVAVLGNDSDADGDPLTLTDVGTGTARGAVTMVGDTVVYDPAGRFEDLAAGATAIDTFDYSVSDSRTAAVTGAVSVTVTGVDDSPVAVDDEAAVLEDAASTAIDVLANDTDADGGPKQVVAVDDSNAHGTVGVAGPGTGLTYTPAPDYCNSGQGPLDTFTYSVNGGTSATVRVAVACVDDAPVAVDDDEITPEDTDIDVYPLVNDSDPDGDPLTLTDAGNASSGAVTADLDGGFVTFTPVQDFCGLASFDYTVSDGTTTTSATVNVLVTCVNDAPVAVDDDANTTENTPVDVHVLLNDLDAEGDALALTSAENATSGSVTADLDGGYVTFTPDANFCGSASFDYTVSDGVASDSGHVTVIVDCT